MASDKPYPKSNRPAAGEAGPRRLPGERGWRLDYSAEEARALERSRAWLGAMTRQPPHVWAALARWLLRELSAEVMRDIARALRPHLLALHAEQREGRP